MFLRKLTVILLPLVMLVLLCIMLPPLFTLSWYLGGLLIGLLLQSRKYSSDMPLRSSSLIWQLLQSSHSSIVRPLTFRLARAVLPSQSTEVSVVFALRSREVMLSS